MMIMTFFKVEIIIAAIYILIKVHMYYKTHIFISQGDFYSRMCHGFMQSRMHERIILESTVYSLVWKLS